MDIAPASDDTVRIEWERQRHFCYSCTAYVHSSAPIKTRECGQCSMRNASNFKTTCRILRVRLQEHKSIIIIIVIININKTCLTKINSDDWNATRFLRCLRHQAVIWSRRELCTRMWFSVSNFDSVRKDAKIFGLAVPDRPPRYRHPLDFRALRRRCWAIAVRWRRADWAYASQILTHPNKPEARKNRTIEGNKRR